MRLNEILDVYQRGDFMSLSLKERRAVVREVSQRYKKTNRKEKGKILDEFVKLTGYNRCYAAYLLRMYEKKVAIYGKDGKRNVFIADNGYIGRKDRRNKELRLRKRNRKRIYEEDVLNVLIYLWQLSDFICGKRLVPYIREVLPHLKKQDNVKFKIDRETEEKLLRISPATVDRLIKRKGLSHIKPGTLLKHSIPIRTFADWNEKELGFVEVDLVGHDGGILRGDFIYSLDVTDVYSGWTETEAVKNKAQRWVFSALKDIRKRFPFDIKGIDSDNASEFINAHLLNYCEREHITFTRSRPYRKNDNCFIEQKNYSVVRRAVGYLRYDTDKELRVLNELYGVLRLYTNFFLPSIKLIEKTRIGSKVVKRYDTPRTPYRRIMDEDDNKVSKERLRKQYDKLNPIELKRKIDKLQEKLYQLYKKKRKERKQNDKLKSLSSNIPNNTSMKRNDFVYNLSEATK